MKTTVRFMGVGIELKLIYRRKYSNGRTAIEAVSVEEDEPFGVLTVNVEAADIADDEIIVKTYSENEEWAPQVLAAFPENFIDTGRSVQTGWVSCPIYKFVQPKEA